MNRQFPALRGLAILFVIINHSIVMSDVIPQRFGHAGVTQLERLILFSIKEIGLLAVPIFLFISGAFLVYAIQNRDLKQSYQIIIKNLVTIITPYLLWSIAFYVLVFFMFNETYSLAGYLKNILVGYPFNFVPLIIFFYLIAPLLIRAGRKYALALLLVIFVYQLLLFNFLQPGSLGFTFPAWAEVIKPSVLWTTLANWGIFFPLGMIFNMHSKKITPILTRYRWALVALTVASFILIILNEQDFIILRVVDVVGPLVAMLLAPIIPRDRIPAARQLEILGKRAYGLYLTNLIVLSLIIFAFQKLVPQLLDYRLISTPIIFILAFFLPQALMRVMEMYPKQTGYRYVFG